jgi:hypothetical protein
MPGRPDSGFAELFQRSLKTGIPDPCIQRRRRIKGRKLQESDDRPLPSRSWLGKRLRIQRRHSAARPSKRFFKYCNTLLKVSPSTAWCATKGLSCGGTWRPRTTPSKFIKITKRCAIARARLCKCECLLSRAREQTQCLPYYLRTGFKRLWRIPYEK